MVYPILKLRKRPESGGARSLAGKTRFLIIDGGVDTSSECLLPEFQSLLSEGLRDVGWSGSNPCILKYNLHSMWFVCLFYINRSRIDLSFKISNSFDVQPSNAMNSLFALMRDRKN